MIDKYNIFYCEFRILGKKHIRYYFYSNTVDLVPYIKLTFHHIILYQLRNGHIFNIYFGKYCCNVLDSLRKCKECNGNYLKNLFGISRRFYKYSLDKAHRFSLKHLSCWV